jgi:hypothetical protein
MKTNIVPWYLVLIGLLFSVTASASRAAIVTWNSATTGGSWSISGNWNPSTGAPTTGDTATLDNATADRVVYYDTAASGTLDTLNITETSGYLNQLTLYKSLTVTNPIVLGATSGTSEILINTSLGSSGSGTSGASLTLTASSVTVNSGGVLGLVVCGTQTSGSNNQYTPKVTGTVVISGGQVIVYAGYYQYYASNSYLGGLSMSSGTLTLGARYSSSYSNCALNYINISGNVAITGGAIDVQNGSTLVLTGGTNTINDVTFTSGKAPNISLTGANQIFSSDVDWNTATFTFAGTAGSTGGTITKSVGATDASRTLTIGNIQMGQGRASSTTTMKLTSNVTSVGTSQLSGFSTLAAGNTIFLGIDTNGHTLDLTSNTGATTPWVLSGSTSGKGNMSWSLTNSAGSSTPGKIKAQGFDFSAATGAGVSVGSNVILESVGTSVANNLSAVSGTIAATSTFLYSGSATSASEATLVSTRTIGNLQVQTGFLNLNQAAFTAAGSVLISSGGLDINGTSAGTLTLANATSNFTLSGGTLELTLGSTYDEIIGNGGTFSLSGGTIALSGTIAAGTYDIFQNFATTGNTVSDSLTFTGLTNGYTATFDAITGDLIVSVPEPQTCALIAASVICLLFSLRKRRNV